MFLLIRGFQIWSQNWVWIIFQPYLSKKKLQKIILVYFDGFSVKIWVKYYPNSVLRSYLNPFIKTSLLDRQYVRKFEKMAFHSIFKISSHVQEPKMQFLRWKWHRFVFHISWHGISSANLEKVEFGEKWKPLFIRAYIGTYVALQLKWPSLESDLFSIFRTYF